MMVLIDNYDSFTYNLAQAFLSAGARVVVLRNDAVGLPELAARCPAALVLSPGPGDPTQAGISLAAISYFAPRIPVLGVCLGHQAIAAAFGCRIVRAARIMHGKTSWIHHKGKGIYEGIPNPFQATRYHSLIVERAGIPPQLEVSAWTARGEIMGLRHRNYPVEGVQYHPESILTQHGDLLLGNFLKSCSARNGQVMQEEPHDDQGSNRNGG